MGIQQRLVLLCLAALATALACRVPSECPSGIPDAFAASDSAERLVRGGELYARHCAVCHGARGRGDGEAARFLFPPARDFGRGRFRLVSSENGAPYDRDLVETLRRGIPGSGMSGWSWLAEEDLWALAAQVRALAFQGLSADLEDEARRADDPLLLAAAGRIARERLTPDRPQPRPAVGTGDATESPHPAPFVSTTVLSSGRPFAPGGRARPATSARSRWPVG
jgi:mono/diheme cytochrome c family protein